MRILVAHYLASYTTCMAHDGGMTGDKLRRRLQDNAPQSPLVPIPLLVYMSLVTLTQSCYAIDTLQVIITYLWIPPNNARPASRIGLSVISHDSLQSVSSVALGAGRHSIILVIGRYTTL